jgi:hypothetical protein
MADTTSSSRRTSSRTRPTPVPPPQPQTPIAPVADVTKKPLSVSIKPLRKSAPVKSPPKKDRKRKGLDDVLTASQANLRLKMKLNDAQQGYRAYRQENKLWKKKHAKLLEALDAAGVPQMLKEEKDPTPHTLSLIEAMKPVPTTNRSAPHDSDSESEPESDFESDSDFSYGGPSSESDEEEKEKPATKKGKVEVKAQAKAKPKEPEEKPKPQAKSYSPSANNTGNESPEL